MVHSAGGYDAGQKIKRRQRFMAVDTLGLVLPVLVTTANVGERFGGKSSQTDQTISPLNISIDKHLGGCWF